MVERIHPARLSLLFIHSSLPAPFCPALTPTRPALPDLNHVTVDLLLPLFLLPSPRPPLAASCCEGNAQSVPSTASLLPSLHAADIHHSQVVQHKTQEKLDQSCGPCCFWCLSFWRHTTLEKETNQNTDKRVQNISSLRFSHIICFTHVERENLHV